MSKNSRFILLPREMMKYIYYMFGWFLELMLILVHFPMYVLNSIIPLESENKTPTQKYPVILVERWFRHNVFHFFAKLYLERKGFQVYTINHTLAFGTFESAARKLGNFIDEKKLDQVVLIGLSAGGLTILEYLQHHHGWKRVHLFFAVGSPLHGSPLAHFFPFTTSLKEMIPGSNFLQNMYCTEILHKERIYTITAHSDNLVPQKYGQMSGAHNVRMDMVGHNLLHTFWLPTYTKIAEIITRHN